MPEYLSPGVYVEEVDTGPKPIQGVGTATAVFVGYSERAQAIERSNGDQITRDVLNQPQLITNWSQYTESFGGFVEGAYLPQAVYGYFQNGGTRCYVVSVKTIPKAQAALLNTDGKPQLVVQAKQAGFEGLRLRVSIAPVAGEATPKRSSKSSKDEEGEEKSTPVPASSTGSFNITVERENLSGGWKTEETLKDVTLEEVDVSGKKQVKVVYKDNKAPKWIELAIPEDAALNTLWPREQQQSLKLENKALSPATSEEFRGNISERTGIEGLEALDDVTMVCVPDLMTTAPGQDLDLEMVKAVQTMIIAHCERMGDRVAILDAPPNMNPQAVRDWRVDAVGYDSSYASLYYPWIQVQDPVLKRGMLVPPSGHVAGIWAKTDNVRGVHKAPANETIRGCTGLAFNVTKGEQDILNPVGVNCIRALPGMGIRVWGARTLASNASWRYINVRRLFNYVEKSIERGTMWVVFEPNDSMLWGRVIRDVSQFLTQLWGTGALFGSSPDQAFYVKCDEELNPPSSRDQGKLIIEIGMAPVKPAEFVIFRISQWAGGEAEVQESGGEE